MRNEEFRVLHQKTEAQAEETREFNREILLRNEKVYTSVIAEMEERRLQIRKGTEQLEAGTRQIQANTQAVLSVLDGLNSSSS